MNVPHSIEFRGRDEEIEKYLSEFAGAVEGWVARDRRRGGWVAGGGARLSTNPNTLPWRIHLTRVESQIAFQAEAFRLPWNRAKGARVAAFRQGQLADFLETRLRGGGSEKFAGRRLPEPFATWGSDTAAITASYTWTAASAIGALALGFAALTLLSLFVMDGTITEATLRAEMIEAAQEIPLPPSAERAAIGFGFRLGCAMLFAFPLAFLLGLVHTLALVATELWPRAARMGQASVFFQAVLLAIAFFPILSWLALPGAILVPLATHAGYTLPWSRRRERVRSESRPRPAIVAAAAVLGAIVLAALAPRAAEGTEFLNRMALFRDRYLLGSPPGRLIARFYYRHTLYAAYPLKQIFSSDPAVPTHQQRTAWVEESDRAERRRDILKSLDFTILSAGSTFLDRADIHSKVHAPDRKAMIAALDELSRDAFRGHALRDVYGLAWKAVYHAGPPFLLLLFLATCTPWISMIFRTLHPRIATLSVLFCFLTTAGVILWDLGRKRDLFELMDRMERSPEPGLIAGALAHSSELVRHAAAYQACQHPHPSLAEPLLKTADDPDLRVRLWAVAAMGKTRDPRVLPKLLERLKDPQFFVRYRAAEGLGFLGQRGAVEPLRTLMREGSWYEGLYALEALRRIER